MPVLKFHVRDMQVLAAVAAVVILGASSARSETMLGMTDMVAPEAPGAHVMTFYVSAEPGEEFPLHSHGGSGIVLLVKGEAMITYADGTSAPLKAGEVFSEGPGDVHGAKMGDDGPVEFIWTIVLPDGAELETPYTQ